MWCIPPEQSAEFVYHMEDVEASPPRVPEVYHRPYDPRYPVVGLDETFLQLIGEAREPLPCRPGDVRRYDSVYARNGVAGLFMAFERSGNGRPPRDPLAGWRHVEAAAGRTRGDWAHFVRDLLEGRYKDAEKLVLVMDQLNTHSPASLYEAFPPDVAKRLADRLEVHHTPRHGSWLNVAEIELSALARDLPDRLGERADLERHLAAWEQRRNGEGVKANWQFTTADARVKLRKLYPTADG